MKASFGAIIVWAGIMLAQPVQADSRTLSVATQDGEIIFSAVLDEGQGWCMHWNHSVAGFLVRECYRVRNGHMVLERAHQPDFAAGLGHIPGRGHMSAAPEGGYWIEAINEPVPDDCYLLRAGGPTVNHRIVLDDAQTEHSLSIHAPRQRVSIALAPNGFEGERAC